MESSKKPRQNFPKKKESKCTTVVLRHEQQRHYDINPPLVVQPTVMPYSFTSVIYLSETVAGTINAAYLPLALFTILSVIIQEQILMTWFLLILDAVTFGTFSPNMRLLRCLSYGMLMILKRIALSVFTAVIATIDCLTTFLLEFADPAVKGAQIMWKTCEAVIPRVFPQLAISQLVMLLSLSKFSFGSFPSLPDWSDDAITGHSCAISYMLALMYMMNHLLNLILPLEMRIPLTIMVSLSWLSQPLDDNGRTRADFFADKFARRSAINRSYNTAPLLGLGCVLAPYTALYNLVLSGASSFSFTTTILVIWILQSAMMKRTVKNVDIPEPLRKLMVQLQNDSELCLWLLKVGSEQRVLLRRFRESLQEKDHDVQILRAQMQGLLNANNNLSIRDANMIRQTQQQQGQISRLNNSLLAANNSIKTLETDLNLSQRQYVDVQFDTALLQSTSTNIAPEQVTISPFTIPFVLVLVDGDAYKWSGYHFTGPQPAGAKAAQAIKDAVRAYILKTQPQIPLLSCIIVRVFQNIVGGVPFIRHVVEQFAKDFTESMPLFDYTDCGTGKERADSKIQELMHLFIRNPACRAIFLAAAKDNGFARLLEQYECDDTVREKVVVIHPGYVIREIDELRYKSVEWPSVFEHESMPVAARMKAASMAKTAVKREEVMDKELKTVFEKFVFEKTYGLGAFRDLSSGALGVGMESEGESEASGLNIEASIDDID